MLNLNFQTTNNHLLKYNEFVVNLNIHPNSVYRKQLLHTKIV